MEKITGHQSLRGRGGVIAVLCKTHWVGLSEPSWERETDLQLPRTHVLRFGAGTPDQHRQNKRLYHRMRICAVERELFRNNGERFWCRTTLCPTRGVSSPLSRHGAPQGSSLLMQGRRWVVVAWKNQREYDGGWSIPGQIFGRPRAGQASFPRARYTTSTRAVRGAWCFQVHEVSAFPRWIQRNVDESRGAAVVS